MKYEEFEINHKYIIKDSAAWQSNSSFFETIVVAKYEKSKIIKLMTTNGGIHYHDDKEYTNWKLMEDLGEIQTEVAQIPSIR